MTSIATHAPPLSAVRQKRRTIRIRLTRRAGPYVCLAASLRLLAGFHHYFQKPADPFAIEAAIRAHVEPDTEQPDI